MFPHPCNRRLFGSVNRALDYVQEVSGSSSGLDKHSGSKNNWEVLAAFAMTSANTRKYTVSNNNGSLLKNMIKNTKSRLQWCNEMNYLQLEKISKVLLILHWLHG